MLAMYISMMDSAEDRVTFEQIYMTYRNLMFDTAMKILGNIQDAEDAVQQAFLSIMNHLGKISDVNCPQTRSYIVIITERKAIDLLRKRTRESGLPLNEAAAGLEIPLPGDHGLADAMAALPAQYREILLLRYDNGYSVRELARMLDMSQAAVRKRIYRAKEALKKSLEKEGTAI